MFPGFLHYRFGKSEDTVAGMTGGQGPAGANLAREGALAAAGTILVVAMLALVTSTRSAGGSAPVLPPLARGVDPLLAAAGDIACSPSDDGYRNGGGAANRCRQRATADLLRRGGYDAILLLGDLQHETGTAADFRTSFARSRG